MSTDKPHILNSRPETIDCRNLLHQNFTQKAPNLVWVSGIPYIKAGGKRHYLCILCSLFKERLPF